MSSSSQGPAGSPRRNRNVAYVAAALTLGGIVVYRLLDSDPPPPAAPPHNYQAAVEHLSTSPPASTVERVQSLSDVFEAAGERTPETHIVTDDGSAVAAWDGFERNNDDIIGMLFSGAPAPANRLFRNERLNPADKPLSDKAYQSVAAAYEEHTRLLRPAFSTAQEVSADEFAALIAAGLARSVNEAEFERTLPEEQQAELEAKRTAFFERGAARLREKGISEERIASARNSRPHILPPERVLGFEPFIHRWDAEHNLFGAEFQELPGTQECFYQLRYATIEAARAALRVSLLAESTTRDSVDEQLVQLSERFDRQWRIPE